MQTAETISRLSLKRAIWPSYALVVLVFTLLGFWWTSHIPTDDRGNDPLSATLSQSKDTPAEPPIPSSLAVSWELEGGMLESLLPRVQR